TLSYNSITNTGTVEFVGYGTTGTHSIGGGGNFSTFTNLLIAPTAGTDNFKAAGSLAVSGNFTVQADTFDLNGNTLSVAGNFTNSGTLAATSGGTVSLTGAAQAIHGSSTFNNLTDTTAGATLTFDAGSTQTVTGTLTLQGASGNLIKLRSSSSPSQWSINAG